MSKQIKFETFIKSTFEEPSSKKRAEILGDYEKVEEILEKFEEKESPVKEMADYLGNVAMGLESQHGSVQLYAYDNLLKSLSEIDGENSPDDIDTIVEEAIFDVASEKNPMKKVYMLGLLHSRSSKTKLDDIEKKIQAGDASLDDVKIKQDIDIIAKVRKATKRLEKKFKENQDIEEIVDYITNDFSGDKKEVESAKLVSHYYDTYRKKGPNPENRPDATGMPDTCESLIGSEDLGIGFGNGIPRYKYALPRGWHPSKEKVDEADSFGMELTPQAAFFEGDKKIFIDAEISPNLIRLYNRRIRHYKDAGDYKRVLNLENAYRERVWRDLEQNKDPIILGRDKEDMVIVKRTIRDFSDEEDSSFAENELKSVMEENLAQDQSL